jgi:hypothetical protein
MALETGLHHQGLGQARHADHEAVAAGKDGREQIVDDLLLADDHFADLLPERDPRLAEAFERGRVDLGGRGVLKTCELAGAELGHGKVLDQVSRWVAPRRRYIQADGAAGTGLAGEALGSYQPFNASLHSKSR